MGNQKAKYEVFVGAKDTMERIAKRGVTALNCKTMRRQIIDKKAKYEVVCTGGICHALMSDKDLRTIAKQKGLTL